MAIGKVITTGPPKSRASKRTLPIPDDVLPVLRAARKRQPEERLLLGDGYNPEDYVGCDETGKPYNPGLLTFRWSRMLEDLKIDHVRLHDARHTCGTLMHLNHVPIAVISAWLGHASAAFTQAVYTHSQDDALNAAAQTFQRDVTTRDTETNAGS